MTLDPFNAFVERPSDAPATDGPLTGITIGVKANIAVAGLHWTAGMALLRDRIAEQDAEVVARLRAAGASITGIVNMEEAALGAKTDNPWFGPTNNPHRMGYTPGGSSGGSGAAVAAGLCDVALGTDTMGSIRIPAAYCGVYGFKPAWGAVSQNGLELAEPDFDAIGPLAHSLDLLERVARVMSDVGEQTAAAGWATIADLGGVDCEPAVLEGFARARAACGAMTEITLPHPLSRVRFAGFIKTVRFMAKQFADADPALLSDHLRKLIAYGPRRSDADWAEDQRVLADTADALRSAIARHGTLLLPTAPQTAFAHIAAAPANQADFTCLANVAGLPALSLPAGQDNDRLPVGVQLVGLPGCEADMFARARVLDAALNAYRAPSLQSEGVSP